jgi:glycosyltransferase involved in cell wall biosynthesis
MNGSMNMENTIKISIIVPVYNVERYLRKCLDSCVNQTLDDIEIIVVNDASPDRCDRIMREYAASHPEKIRCICLDRNVGLGQARNIGIEAARGKFLMFVDSDDFIDVSMCQKMYDAAAAQKAEIAYCDFFSANEGGNQYCVRLPGGFRSDKVAALFHCAPGCMVQKSVLTDNGLFFPPKVYYEDLAIVPLWFLHAKKVCGIREALYYYVQREGSILHSINLVSCVT